MGEVLRAVEACSSRGGISKGGKEVSDRRRCRAAAPPTWSQFRQPPMWARMRVMGPTWSRARRTIRG